MIQIAIELVIAIFALLGLYGSIAWLARRWFGARNTMLAIEILTQRDAESAEVLIRDALFGVLGYPSGRIIVLTLPQWETHPILNQALKDYGISCYVIEPEEE